MKVQFRHIDEISENNTLMSVSLLTKPVDAPFPKRLHWRFWNANLWTQEELSCVEEVLLRHMAIDAHHWWDFWKQEGNDGYQYIGELNEMVKNWKPAIAQSAKGLAEAIDVSYHLPEFPH